MTKPDPVRYAIGTMAAMLLTVLVLDIVHIILHTP